MGNKLIQTFLQDSEHKKMYETYLQNLTDDNKKEIEEKFKLHVMKINLLSYFSKVLYCEAQRFDKNIRATTTVSLLDGDDSVESYTLKTTDEPKIENYFENERLFNLVSNLSDDNKKLLYLLYVKDLDEVQVAEKLGITKQAVNKRKNNLLKKLRKKIHE